MEAAGDHGNYSLEAASRLGPSGRRVATDASAQPSPASTPSIPASFAGAQSHEPLYLPPAALIELEHALRSGEPSQISVGSLHGVDPQRTPQGYRHLVAQHQSSASASEDGSASYGAASRDTADATNTKIPFAILENMRGEMSLSPSQATGVLGSTMSMDWFAREFWAYYVDLVEREDHQLGSSHKGSTAAGLQTQRSVEHDAATPRSSLSPTSPPQPQLLGISLPVARIKKVMKSDEEVRMISAEAPMLLARACEVFIAEMTARAYTVAEAAGRKTITKQDVTAASAQTDLFDFLLDTLPRRAAQQRTSQHHRSGMDVEDSASAEGTEGDMAGAH